MESRDSINGPADYLHTMRSAKKRYRMELKSRTEHGLRFRDWARRTYNPQGAHGKLKTIVSRRGR